METTQTANARSRRLSVPPRSIGTIGTISRLAVGLAFLELGIVGLPPIGHLLPQWQILIGLVALPAAATFIVLARLRFTRAQVIRVGPVTTLINCALVTLLLLVSATRGVTLVFLGEAMLLAALRGYGGCETLAFSNWLLGRDDQVGCMLFTPVDRLESMAMRVRSERNR